MEFKMRETAQNRNQNMKIHIDAGVHGSIVLEKPELTAEDMLSVAHLLGMKSATSQEAQAEALKKDFQNGKTDALELASIASEALREQYAGESVQEKVTSEPVKDKPSRPRTLPLGNSSQADEADDSGFSVAEMLQAKFASQDAQQEKPVSVKKAPAPVKREKPVRPPVSRVNTPQPEGTVRAGIICHACGYEQEGYVKPHFRYMHCKVCSARTYIDDVNDDGTPDVNGRVKFGSKPYFTAEERYNHRVEKEKEAKERVAEFTGDEEKAEEMTTEERIDVLLKSDFVDRSVIDKTFTAKQLLEYARSQGMAKLPRLKSDIIDRLMNKEEDEADGQTDV